MRSPAPAAVKIMVAAALLSGCSATDPASPGLSPSAPATASTGSAPASSTPGGVTSAPATTGAPAPTGTTLPRVVLNRTGGFAGQTRTVTVEPDGRWTVTGDGARGSGRLTPAQLDQLRTLVADPRFAAEATRPTASTVCRDAYEYQLTVGAARSFYVDCPSDATRPPATRAAVELLTRATGG